MAKFQNFLQNSGFAKVAQTKKRTNSHTCYHENKYLIADIVVCLFTLLTNQSVLKRKKDHDRSKLHCYFRKL